MVVSKSERGERNARYRDRERRFHVHEDAPPFALKAVTPAPPSTACSLSPPPALSASENKTLGLQRRQGDKTVQALEDVGGARGERGGRGATECARRTATAVAAAVAARGESPRIAPLGRGGEVGMKEEAQEGETPRRA